MRRKEETMTHKREKQEVSFGKEDVIPGVYLVN